MNIVVDINHPAHVHFYKYFIPEMLGRGHKILVTATKKDVSFDLLNKLNINFISLGSYGNSLYQKMINLFIIDYKMLQAVKNFKPDIFLGLGSVRAAHIGSLLKKPSILFGDTEISQQRSLIMPFVTKIFTPACFLDNLGPKQIRYPGYHQMAYLHPKYFKPDTSVLDSLNLSKTDDFIVLRKVSWNATHDIGYQGIKNQVDVVHDLEQFGQVFITSENGIVNQLKKNLLTISPEKLHSLLYYSKLYFGDGQTTASEASTLGIHSILVSPVAHKLGMSYHMSNYDLLWFYNNDPLSLIKAKELLNCDNLKQLGKNKQLKIFKENIDLTSFLIWFVEQYPESNLLLHDKNIYNKFITM